VLGKELGEEGRVVVSLAGTGAYGKTANLLRVIRQGRYDIIHSHGVSACLDAAPIRALRGVRHFVHTFHFGSYPNLAKRYLLGQRLACRAADRLVAVADSQRAAIVRHLRVPSDRIRTIVNGVRPNAYAGCARLREDVLSEFSIDPSRTVFGCVAVMRPAKGLNHLIPAVKLLAEHVPRCQVIVVGGGPLEPTIREQAREAGLSDRILFTGWRHDVDRLMAAFDVFVSSSLAEAFAMVILEAMAAGVPVIATDIADNRAVVADGESGLIVPPADPASLAKAMKFLAQEPATRRAFGEAGRSRWSARYTVDAMVSQYAQLYDQLI
jgi:glycosyltransferase involved in cell wall biosynthesis